MRGRNKNKIYNRFDFGRIKATDISVAKPETLREFAERLQREETERREAPVRAAERELTTTLRTMNEEYRKVWSMPIEKLRRLDREVLEVSMPSFDVNQIDYGFDAEEGTRAGLAAKKLLDDFIASLPQRGIALSSDGVSRFRFFVSALVVCRSAAVTTELLQTAFAWLAECFGDKMQVDSPATTEPVVESSPLTLDDVLNQGLDGSRDSDRRLRTALENDFVAETGVMAGQFVAHLRDVWNFVPDNKSWRAIFNPRDGWVVRRNKNLMDARTFDEARLYASSCGLWPPHLKTAGEYLDEQFRRDGNWGAYKYKLNLLTHRGLTNRPMLDAKDVLGI